jgi:hypothetical protein
MARLYRLIPKPIEIESGDFSGRLDIRGNIYFNEVLFKFIFNREEEVAPLVVRFEANGKEYRYRCLIHDKNNHAMMTPILRHPDFKVYEIIRPAVEPLIQI